MTHEIAQSSETHMAITAVGAGHPALGVRRPDLSESADIGVGAEVLAFEADVASGHFPSDEQQLFRDSLSLQDSAGLGLTSEGWRTYNFEVAEHYTYIADGVRVHNMSGWLGRLGNYINEKVDKGPCCTDQLQLRTRPIRDGIQAVTSKPGRPSPVIRLRTRTPILASVF